MQRGVTAPLDAYGATLYSLYASEDTEELIGLFHWIHTEKLLAYFIGCHITEVFSLTSIAPSEEYIYNKVPRSPYGDTWSTDSPVVTLYHILGLFSTYFFNWCPKPNFSFVDI